MAGVDSPEGDRADERIIHDLESKHGKGILIARQPYHLGARARIDPLDRLAVERRRQKIDNGIQQGLHAFVLECRAAEDRDKGDVADRLAQKPL
jgi:hypothetical protein